MRTTNPFTKENLKANTKVNINNKQENKKIVFYAFQLILRNLKQYLQEVFWEERKKNYKQKNNH